MTLDEMISDCLKVAEAQCKVAAEFWDHKQLAEWLRELQELREKHWDECRQIAHYDNDIKSLREQIAEIIGE